MARVKIKKNDMVKIIAGENKGDTGKVLHVYPKTSQVVVEGCKVAKKAVKPNDNNKNGGWENREMPIHISNVAKVEG